MTELKLVSEDKPKPPRKHQLPAKQLRGVEDPATIILVPMSLVPVGMVQWWSHDGLLLGGIKVNGAPLDASDPGHESRIGYLPAPIPRSWGEEDFHVVIEYEAEDKEARFRLRVYYGCGDPSELHVGESQTLEGESQGKRRLYFKLDKAKLRCNELFRATVEVNRDTPHPILIYGVWLELVA